MLSFIQRHCPLIAPRTEPNLSPVPNPPTITLRIEFTPERLAPPNTLRRNAGEENRAGSDYRRRVLVPVDSDERRDCPRTTTPNPDPTSGRPLPAHSPRKLSKIPKPPGEPGRPGSGGFNVDTELVERGWTREEVVALTNAVRREARRKLNMTVSFRGQRKEHLRKICEEMSDEDHWPALAEYADCWPVLSMLKLTLKYRVEASRRAEAKDINRRIREILSSSPGV